MIGPNQPPAARMYEVSWDYEIGTINASGTARVEAESGDAAIAAVEDMDLNELVENDRDGITNPRRHVEAWVD